MSITDENVRLTLRLPEHLHGSLMHSANSNHRSLNSEIVAKLEALFAAPNQSGKDELLESLVANTERLPADSIKVLIDLTQRMAV